MSATTASDQPATAVERPARERSIAVEMASRISRDSALYTLVTATAFPLALANTAVLTRFLSTSAFGYLAILFFWAGMLTIGLNLLVLRGIERHVWGGSEDMMDTADGPIVHSSIRPGALGTGLLLNASLATLAAVTVALNADALRRLLLLPPSLTTAVVWAGVSGALGSVWRLSSGILRWERRRKAFSTVYVMRWLLALTISWPLLVDGYGPTGAVAATAIGTFVSMVTALILARKSYRLCFDRAALKAIANKNAPMISMIVGLTILHDADVFLLSRVAPASEVGLYRLATRMTSFVSYAVSAFLIAWSPLEASSLFRATYAKLGRARVRATFVSYYVIVGTLLVVLMCITAVPVIAIVAPDYGKSVGFVPLTSVAYLAYGFLVVVARASEFPHRYVIYGSATLGGAAVMIVICLVLGGPLGGYGVALGDLIGALFGAAVVIGACVVSRRRPALDVPRVCGALLIGGLCFAIGAPLAQQAGTPWNVLLGALGLALYPALVVVTGIVPRSDLRHMRLIVGDIRGFRREGRELLSRLRELSLPAQRLLAALLRDRQTPPRAGKLSGIAPHQVAGELVGSLRALARVPGGPAFDDEIGRWLLSTDAVTSKDAVQRRIEEAGAPPAEIHAIESAYNSLRSAPGKAWPTIDPTPARRSATQDWNLDPHDAELLELSLRGNVQPQLLASSEGLTERELDHRLVGSLRRLAGLTPRPSLDRMIAGFLLGGAQAVPPRQLWSAGVDPVELHELELIVSEIRAMPVARWKQVRTAPSRDPVAVVPVV